MRTLTEVKSVLNKLYKEHFDYKNPEPLSINEGPKDFYIINLKKPITPTLLISEDLIDKYIDQFGDEKIFESAKKEIVKIFEKLRNPRKD